MFEVSTREVGSYAGMERREWIVRRAGDPPEAYEVFGKELRAAVRAGVLNSYLREEIPVVWLPKSCVYATAVGADAYSSAPVTRITEAGERALIRDRAERQVAPLIGKLFTMGRGMR